MDHGLPAEVLDPLGLDRTSYHPAPPHASGWAVHPWADAVLPEPAEDSGLMAPAGQLWSTTTDLAGSAPSCSTATTGSSRRPSSRRSGPRRHPRNPATRCTARDPVFSCCAHGTRDLAGHTGSTPGFLATLWADPAEDLAGVVFANATSGPAIRPAGVRADALVRAFPSYGTETRAHLRSSSACRCATWTT